METLPTAVDKQQLVSSFLEIALGQTPETATQFLQFPQSTLIMATILTVVDEDTHSQLVSFHDFHMELYFHDITISQCCHCNWHHLESQLEDWLECDDRKVQMLLSYISLPLSSLLPITEVREDNNPPPLVKPGDGYDLKRAMV
ncbi:hypothetical protein BHM03_00019244 [Ensete ventricosum]|uniref:Uncharacterized protein n=1 Tax=Ensete ventricosum TaxID=4639 RepID=A0A426Y6N9_ENSVE|nr:hypothetical protein B296_00053761 [Ensete ventricosum]RZR91176.1 hypothetical protein BHM03_00019244 [Ensete ventricosum]